VSEPGQTRSERDAEPVEAFRLRSEAPAVMRLSRKVLTGLVGVGAIVVFGALIWALNQGHRRLGGEAELYNTENKTTPDGLSTLPRDYSGLPQIPAQTVVQVGPPMSNDIDKPAPASAAEDSEEQRLAQETEAARTSHLFAPTSARERAAAVTPATPAADLKTMPNGQVEGAPPLDPGALLNMQDRKLAFANGAVDHKTVSPERLENPVSRYVIQAGSIIPAALITGIRSDLPGQVTAQVTENVYDSPTGRYLLIPQGSKLIGAYDSQVSMARTVCFWCGRG
jgi:type IV secretory pathway VirB10-like protein